MTDANPDQGSVSGLTPHLTIPSLGAAAAIDFYIIAFGAEVLDRKLAEDGERLIHAHLRINGASLMLNDKFTEYTGRQDMRPAGTALHLQVADPDAWWTRAMLGGPSRSRTWRTSSGATATASFATRSATPGRSADLLVKRGRAPVVTTRTELSLLAHADTLGALIFWISITSIDEVVCELHAIRSTARICRRISAKYHLLVGYPRIDPTILLALTQRLGY